jgi:hypothetical protein
MNTSNVEPFSTLEWGSGEGVGCVGNACSGLERVLGMCCWHGLHYLGKLKEGAKKQRKAEKRKKKCLKKKKQSRSDVIQKCGSC